jgi:hypothetical protein
MNLVEAAWSAGKHCEDELLSRAHELCFLPFCHARNVCASCNTICAYDGVIFFRPPT